MALEIRTLRALALGGCIALMMAVAAPAQAAQWIPGHYGPGGHWIVGHWGGGYRGPPPGPGEGPPPGVLAAGRVWVPGFYGPQRVWHPGHWR